MTAAFLAPGLFLTVISAVAVGSAAEFDWPNWRGPDHNGISKETGWSSTWPAEGPKQLWKATVGTGFSTVVTANGRVFTMGHASGRDTVVGLDVETGKPIWKHSYAAELEPYLYEGGPNATPTVEGNVVYTVGRRGQLFCLDAASGREIWSRDLFKDFSLAEPPKDWWGITGSPLVVGDLLIINAGTFGVAVEKKSGKPAWSSGKEPCAYATPVRFDHRGTPAVAVFGAHALAALEARTGRELWRHAWKTSWEINAADPVIADGHVFLSSGYGSGGALLRVEGDKPVEVWKSKEMHLQMNPPVLIDGHLYGVSGQERTKAEIRCVEFKTGRVKWAHPFATMGSLAAAGRRLIALSERGELVVAEAKPDAYKELARAQVLGGRCWTVPVLSNGRIYCRNAKGDLVCLDVLSKVAGAPTR